MANLEKLARAVINYDTLSARSLIPAFYASNLVLSDISKPDSNDEEVLVMAAALVELIALRRRQPAPAWSDEVGGLREKKYLLKAATTMRRLRMLCESESPEPLRKRGLLAPPTFLEYV